MKDYYAILGISPSSSEREVKQAYRKLAKKYHPDMNPDNPEANERFKEVSEAYNVIGSPESRADYDYHRSGGSSHHRSFEDLFSNLGFNPFNGRGFGMPHMDPRDPPPVDKIHLELTMDEIRRGGKTLPLKLRINRTCIVCNGRGGEHVEVCHGCAGTGQRHRLQNHGSMVIKTSEPCTLCHGRGKLISGLCHPCHGSGKTSVLEEYNVKIDVTRK